LEIQTERIIVDPEVKNMEENVKDPIVVIKDFFLKNGMVWPKDWLDLQMEVGNNRDEALEEISEILLDEGVIGYEAQGKYFAAANAYLNDQGINEKTWTVLLGQKWGKVTFFKRIHTDGGGFKVHVDQIHVKALGLAHGDYVQVTLKNEVPR
jgi:hypothetical protein